MTSRSYQRHAIHCKLMLVCTIQPVLISQPSTAFRHLDSPWSFIKMPVKSLWIVTDGLPSERHSCSLTGLSTQDAFEFFQRRVVSFQRFVSYPGPEWQLRGTAPQCLAYTVEHLLPCRCRSVYSCLVYSPTASFFSPKTSYKSFNSCHTFALLPVYIPGSQILLFLITSNWNDSQIMEQHFWSCQKEIHKWDHIYEKFNKKLKEEIGGGHVLYLSAGSF